MANNKCAYISLDRYYADREADKKIDATRQVELTQKIDDLKMKVVVGLVVVGFLAGVNAVNVVLHLLGL